MIGSIHTLIFGIFQVPENFLMGHSSLDLALSCKIVLYVAAILIALSHQLMCRIIGLRKTLYFGLLCNLLGLITLFVNQLQGPTGIYALIYLDMLFFGMALTSVINSLVTYIIIEFPKYVGLAVVVLFAFFNLGAMLSSLFQPLKPESVYTILSVLILVSLWFVHIFFFDPPVSKRNIHMKRGSAIWKQLHYRLGLFVMAITAYGLTESTFSLWGFTKIAAEFGSSIADEVVPFFWMFLIIGQFSLLVPLYFFEAKRVFYCLVLMIIAAAFMFPIQHQLVSFIGWIAVAGFGCSAIFPILLEQMEKEMFPFAKGDRILGYIEKSISLMIAGYFLGVGLIDIWVLLKGHSPSFSLTSHFHLAAIFIAFTGAVSLFLDFSRPQHK